MDLQKKRASTLVLSSRSRQSSSSRKLSPVPCSKCVFCRNECTTKHQQTYFPNMINKALYSKYSSSQNYYYTRGLNEFLTNARTTNVIRFKDTLQFEEEEEYLKRFYKRSEYPGKIDMLTEYYKFHKDIARMFMLPSTNTVNRYHDKKRRLEYIRVTKMLKDQNKNDLEMPKTERLKSIPITDRVLDDLELTQSDTHNINRRVTTEVSEVIRPSATKKRVANKENNAKGDVKKSIGIQEVKVSKDVKGGFSSLKKPAKNKEIDQSGDLSGSQTIQELNWKLGEIIHNSYSQNGLDVLSYFENSEQQPNDTISNLNNFLEYIQTNAQSSKLSRIPAISSVIPPAQDIKSLPNTHRSPDPEPKSTASSTKLTIKSKNPSTSQVSYNNQFIPEATLATELLRRVSLDQPRKGSKKVIYTDIDRPLTTVTTTRASVHPTPSAARSKNKATPVSIKIQGFEEALRSRQPTSPRQLNSQHSTSRERVATKFSASLSHRAGDIKSIKYSGDANMRGGVLTSRRESQTNSNLMKVSHKTSAKKKESFNNAVEKNVDMAVHTSQNMTTRPSSHRDMRISLDMYAINRHMSQPGMVGSTITTTYTEKTEGNYVKIQSSKAKPNTSGVHKVKDIKHLSTLGNMDIQDKDIRSVPSSKPSVRAHLTSRGDYRSSNRIEIIPEQDIINLKRSSQQGPRKALTHRENNAVGTHKSHKSEVKFGKFEASGVLMKKGSLPQSAIARDAEQALYEERRYTKDRESSPSKHGYTYNHNNIVNIYVQSRPDTTTSKENIRGMGLGKANTRKPDAFEIASKQTSCRESPSIMSKKEEGSSIKMKNIYGNTYAKPVLPARTKGKVELDLMEKRIKVSDDNHYEILLKIKGK